MRVVRRGVGVDLAGSFAEAVDDGEEEHGGDEEEAATDDVVAHLGLVLKPGEVEGDDVVEDEEAETDEVEDVSEQDGAGDDGGVGVPAEAVEVAGDEGDEAHGDGSADAVAAGSDEHAEVWREHEAHLVGAETAGRERWRRRGLRGPRRAGEGDRRRR